MLVPTDELVRVVLSASHGVIGRAQSPMLKAIQEMRSAKTVASSDSPESLFLMKVVDLSESILAPGAADHLRKVGLFGVPGALIDAIPDASFGRERIFVFEGLLRLIRFTGYFFRFLHNLEKLRPNAVFAVNGEEVPEYIAFCTAGYTIFADVIGSHHMPPELQRSLGSVAQRDVHYAFLHATAFILLHELGHIELGHLDARGVLSEWRQVSLIAQEDLAEHQMREFAADKFALDMFRAEFRPEIMPGLIFFLAPYSMLEIYLGRMGAVHPLAVNRLSSLAVAVDMPDDVREIIGGWIKDRANNFRDFADVRVEQNKNEGGRIGRNGMSVDLAYRTFEEIKCRVMSACGPLELPEDLDRRRAEPEAIFDF